MSRSTGGSATTLALSPDEERPNLTGLRPRVIVVDPETLFAEAVATGFEQAGLSPSVVRTSIGKAVERLDGSGRCAVLVDPEIEGASDDDAHSRLAARDDVHVVLWSASLDHERVRRAVALGYAGVVSKRVRLARVVDALGSVLRGDIAIDVGDLPAAYRSVQRLSYGPHAAVPLTPRERQVLALLAEGIGSAEIAARLSLSAHTVRTHINNVMQKLGVHSRAEAVAHASGRGLVVVRREAAASR